MRSNSEATVFASLNIVCVNSRWVMPFGSPSSRVRKTVN